MLFVPDERQTEFDCCRTGDRGYSVVVPVTSPDDLALALLRQPQYKHDVMAKSDAARILGVDFWANCTEISQLLNRISALRAEVAQVREQLSRSRQ